MTQAAVAQNWFATLALLAWPFVALWPLSNATSQSSDLVDDLGSLSAASCGRQHQACRGYSAVGQDFDTEPCCILWDAS